MITKRKYQARELQGYFWGVPGGTPGHLQTAKMLIIRRSKRRSGRPKISDPSQKREGGGPGSFNNPFQTLCCVQSGELKSGTKLIITLLFAIWRAPNAKKHIITLFFASRRAQKCKKAYNYCVCRNSESSKVPKSK